MLFNNSNVSQVNSQKHLGVILDVKLTFEEHQKNVFNKTNKTIGLLRKLSNLLPRQALITIFKAFVRSYLDYGDVLYDQAFDNSFHGKMESIQYNARLAITGAIRGMSREKIYQEVGLGSLIKTKHNFFKNSFFPSAIIEWNKKDPNLRNSKSISVFKEKILSFIRPSPNSFFDCHSPKGIKLKTQSEPLKRT